MDNFASILQLIVGLVILNVWLLRFNQKTPYRGCEAATLKEEFIAYGLPLWFFYLIGIVKISAALLLIISIWIPHLAFPASAAMAALMIGAVIMHIKVRDSWKKAIPASIVLLLSLVICWLRW